MKSFVLLPLLTALSQEKSVLNYISERTAYENAKVNLCGLHNLTQADIQHRIASCKEVLGDNESRPWGALATPIKSILNLHNITYGVFDSDTDNSLRIYETYDHKRYCSVALKKGRINFASCKELEAEEFLGQIQTYRPYLVQSNAITAGIPVPQEKGSIKFDNDISNTTTIENKSPVFHIAPDEHCLMWVIDPNGNVIFATQYGPQDYCKRDASE
jgi:hypothetical protein